MTTNRRFSLALQALTELKTETSTPPSSAKPTASVPALSDALAQIGSIPSEALFLGIASDGLPVLLNLYDAHPGPMLIAGDAGSGKTAFLQTIAHAAAQTHRPDDVQFGVITNYPEEWEGTNDIPHRAGVFPVGHRSTQEFIHSLATWAHSNKNSHQCMLLLVDDLESVASLELESVQDFRWLLLRGPARRVWPIVTMNAPRYGQVLAWLQNFRTRIFGQVANARVAEALGADNASGLNQLEPRIQFSMREKDTRSSPMENWLRFWLPSC
ncbi:MAG TPA: FtsK/SpoIIIE domain-containing protein [Anaerolineales bacterium]|nr:FtsK/SpoIIIE domain-containing protein [Anaerolineales bacterium]